VNFSLIAFRRVLLAIALAGIIGNQSIIGAEAIREINAHNALVDRYDDMRARKANRQQPNSLNEALGDFTTALAAGVQGDEKWTPNYFDIFLNPTFPFEGVEDWTLLNHILAWTGCAAALAWITLMLSMRKTT
jgi:hypothetical protein